MSSRTSSKLGAPKTSSSEIHVSSVTTAGIEIGGRIYPLITSNSSKVRASNLIHAYSMI